MIEMLAYVLYVVAAMFGIALCLSIAGCILIRRIENTLDRMLDELPWMQWMTFEEILAHGYQPALICKSSLLVLHRKGFLEFRAAGRPSEHLSSCLQQKKFHLSDAENLEFRLVRRGGGNRKRHLREFLNWIPKPVRV